MLYNAWAQSQEERQNLRVVKPGHLCLFYFIFKQIF